MQWVLHHVLALNGMEISTHIEDLELTSVEDIVQPVTGEGTQVCSDEESQFPNCRQQQRQKAMAVAC